MIRFKYRIKPSFKDFMHDAVPNYYDDYIYCMAEDGHAGDLRHCSLYLVCKQNFVNDKQYNENPVGIVANNMEEATEVFAEEYHEAAYVIIEVEPRCDKIMIEKI